MPTALETALVAHLDEFVGYVRRRIGDPDMAADVVQDAVLKALRNQDSLQNQDRLLPWFHQVLRNTLNDVFRRRQSEGKAFARLALEPSAVQDAERALCRCVEALIPTLKPEYGELVRALDLEEIDRGEVAARLGITPNNLKVRHHRARQQLRQRLEQSCGVCAVHGCLDCHCDAHGA